MNYTNSLDELGFEDVTLDALKNKFLHKWVEYNNQVIYIKYIYPNWHLNYDPYNWVFLGRNKNNEFVRIEHPNKVFMSEIKLNIIE